MSNEIALCSHKHGCVVAKANGRTLTIDFARGMNELLSDETKIIHEEYKTIGEGNRGWLHERLDDFLNNLKRDEVTFHDVRAQLALGEKLIAERTKTGEDQ